MCISDWSSDVCYSELAGVSALIAARRKRLEGFERTAPNPPVDRAGRANDRRRFLAAALLRLTTDPERADGGVTIRLPPNLSLPARVPLAPLPASVGGTAPVDPKPPGACPGMHPFPLSPPALSPPPMHPTTSACRRHP